ncbi:universal stress protein [Oxalobacteraceae bacterium OM1]|nr:universal stress protein [Oxalobacteraceae bacterium OM1]
MSYKTVLVHVDESARASERIKIAAAIAMAEHAHLIGTAVTGASRYFLQARLQEMDPNLREHVHFLRERAEHGLDDFEAAARRIEMPSFEKRLVDDEAGGGICLQARYADLVVIGQNDPKEGSPVVLPDFPQYVVLNSGRPVLLVPYTGRFDTIGNRVLIGWDASMAASHAITGALPLLRCAQKIHVAVIRSGKQPQAGSSPPGKEICLYLARHGIKAEMVERETEAPVADALLDLAAELHSDLMVAGAYGHSRFREIMLGDVTARILQSMCVPVLMSA